MPGRRAAAALAAPSPAEATALYDRKCAKCHEPEEVPTWVAQQPADSREAAVFEFLQKHRKATEAENRLLAAYYAMPPDS
jgi:hypothetical protein